MSIGEALTAARRQAGLSVADVSQRTRIREAIIRGIENGDYSACGGDFYARGHIRSIAKVVGTDAGPLIREYDANQQPHAMPGTKVSRPGTDVYLPGTDASWPVPPIRAHGRRQLGQRTFVVLVLLVLAVLGFAAYQVLPGSGHVSGVAGRARPAAPHSAGNGGPNPVPDASRPPPPAATATATPSRAAAPAPAVPARTLTPVSATAFGPGGRGQGESTSTISVSLRAVA